MTRNFRWFFTVLGVLAVLVANNSYASTKITLVTVSPGDVIFQAFGHVCIVIEDTEKQAQGATIYEYGAVNPSSLFGKPDRLQALADFFQSKIKTRAAKFKSEINPKWGIPEFLVQRYLRKKSSYRELSFNLLSLNEEQAKALVDRLQKDVDAGEYSYENFQNNCATRMRDALYSDSVLGIKAREALNGEVKTSLQDIAMESIDEAVQKSLKKRVILFPEEYQKFAAVMQLTEMLGAFGLPYEFRSAKEFYDAVQSTATNLENFKQMLPIPLNEYFREYFLRKELTANPVQEYKTLFTPKRLKEALLKTISNETKFNSKDVIEQEEIDRERANSAVPTPEKDKKNE